MGSSSYVTERTGLVTQHMEYVPFGETLTDEHINSKNSPFKYNGKEFDEETEKKINRRTITVQYINKKTSTN